MNEQHKYRATDKMSDLICDNYSLLMVMSRFGLSLGFGDKSVKDVCEAQHVDYRTFLAVANFISEEQYSYSADNDSFSIPALMDYLKRAHAYFLDFNLPAMRRKLIEAIDCSRDNDVAYLILKFFDEYAKEVRRHMEYENKAVFTYVEQLLQGRPSDVYNIATFASKHNQIDTKQRDNRHFHAAKTVRHPAKHDAHHDKCAAKRGKSKARHRPSFAGKVERNESPDNRKTNAL